MAVIAYPFAIVVLLCVLHVPFTEAGDRNGEKCRASMFDYHDCFKECFKKYTNLIIKAALCEKRFALVTNNQDEVKVIDVAKALKCVVVTCQKTLPDGFCDANQRYWPNSRSRSADQRYWRPTSRSRSSAVAYAGSSDKDKRYNPYYGQHFSPSDQNYEPNSEKPKRPWPPGDDFDGNNYPDDRSDNFGTRDKRDKFDKRDKRDKFGTRDDDKKYLPINPNEKKKPITPDNKDDFKNPRKTWPPDDDSDSNNPHDRSDNFDTQDKGDNFDTRDDDNKNLPVNPNKKKKPLPITPGNKDDSDKDRDEDDSGIDHSERIKKKDSKIGEREGKTSGKKKDVEKTSITKKDSSYEAMMESYLKKMEGKESKKRSSRNKDHDWFVTPNDVTSTSESTSVSDYTDDTTEASVSTSVSTSISDYTDDTTETSESTSVSTSASDYTDDTTETSVSTSTSTFTSDYTEDDTSTATSVSTSVSVSTSDYDSSTTEDPCDDDGDNSSHHDSNKWKDKTSTLRGKDKSKKNKSKKDKKIKKKLDTKTVKKFPPGKKPDSDDQQFTNDFEGNSRKKSFTDDGRNSDYYEGKKDNLYPEDKENRYPGDKDNRYPGEKDNLYSGEKDNRYSGEKDNRYSGEKDNRYSGDNDNYYSGDKENRYSGDKDNRYSGEKYNRYSEDKDNRYSGGKDNYAVSEAGSDAYRKRNRDKTETGSDSYASSIAKSKAYGESGYDNFGRDGTFDNYKGNTGENGKRTGTNNAKYRGKSGNNGYEGPDDYDYYSTDSGKNRFYNSKDSKPQYDYEPGYYKQSKWKRPGNPKYGSTWYQYPDNDDYNYDSRDFDYNRDNWNGEYEDDDYRRRREYFRRYFEYYFKNRGSQPRRYDENGKPLNREWGYDESQDYTGRSSDREYFNDQDQGKSVVFTESQNDDQRYRDDEEMGYSNFDKRSENGNSQKKNKYPTFAWSDSKAVAGGKGFSNSRAVSTAVAGSKADRYDRLHPKRGEMKLPLRDDLLKIGIADELINIGKTGEIKVFKANKLVSDIKPS